MPPGDQIVSARLPESINALPGCPALATGVCSKGVASQRTTSVLHVVPCSCSLPPVLLCLGPPFCA